MFTKVRKALLIGIAVFVVLYALIWLASPSVTRLVLEKVLESEKVELTKDSSVRLNLFISRLTISNFVLHREQKPTLRLERLVIRYGLFHLLRKEVHVRKVVLQGLDVEIDLQGENAHAAGFQLNRTAAQQKQLAEEESKPGKDPADTPFAIAAPSIELRDINLRIKNGAATHELEFKDIIVDRTMYKGAILESAVSVSGSVDSANFNIQANVSYGSSNSKAELEFELLSYPLASINYLLPTSIEELNGDLDFKIQSLIEKTDQAIFAKQLESEISLNSLSCSDSSYSALISTLLLSISEGSVNFDEQNNYQVDAKIDFESEQIESAIADTEQQLAGLEKISIKGASINAIKDEFKVNIAEVNLNNTWFSKLTEIDESLTPIIQLPLIEASEINIDHQQLSVDRLRIAGGKSSLLISESGDISNLIQLNKNSETPEDIDDNSHASSESSSNQKNAPEPYTFTLNNFIIDEAIAISVADKSITPNFDETFYLESFELSGVSNSDTTRPAQYVLSASDGDFFKLDLKGDIAPFGEKLNGKFDMTIREFSLPQVSPYLSNSLGFNILAGQLDLDYDGSIVEDQLTSEADTFLRATEFKSDKNYDEKDMLGQAAMPLNVALGMLKDGDGNIKLKLPIDGDIRSPEFGVNHVVGKVVQKAAMSQAKSYLIKTFVPYGQVLSVAMAAGSYALKVRFEDLPYNTMQILPEASQLVFIDQLTALMQDKADLNVKVCPIIIAADSELTAGKTTLSNDDKALLIDLGEQRAAAFKKVIVESKGIASSRLLLCAPEISLKPEAVPAIKFSI